MVCALSTFAVDSPQLPWGGGGQAQQPHNRRTALWHVPWYRSSQLYALCFRSTVLSLRPEKAHIALYAVGRRRLKWAT